MKSYRTLIAGTALCVLSAFSAARADYVQNFDTGSATFSVNDPYWINPAAANGFITQTTNTPAIWPTNPSGFGNSIPVDASGTGYFLFDGTYVHPTGGLTIPAGNDQFFISPVFSVTPNSNYSVSFFLTNADANGIGQAAVQPEIGGSLLGSPVTATGIYSTSGWQQFSFSWNSGANTSATLTLHDFSAFVSGNDFGIDAISVKAVPEPMSASLLLMGASLVLARRRRSAGN